MYSRRLESRTLTFGHEGVLYKNSFVMYDRETGSLWVHTTGKAIRGPLKGKQLTFLPSMMTTWGRWRSEHPETLVLNGRRAEGMMGAFNRDRGRYGLSVGHGTRVKLYPFTLLARDGVLNDEVDGLKVVIVMDRATGMGVAFERGDLMFQDRDGQVVDQTGRVWNRLQGVSGELRLTPVPATPWLIDRWMAFFRPGERQQAPAAPHAGRPAEGDPLRAFVPPGFPPVQRPPFPGQQPAYALPGTPQPRSFSQPPAFPPGVDPTYFSRQRGNARPAGMHFVPVAPPPGLPTRFGSPYPVGNRPGW